MSVFAFVCVCIEGGGVTRYNAGLNLSFCSLTLCHHTSTVGADGAGRQRTPRGTFISIVSDLASVHILEQCLFDDKWRRAVAKEVAALVEGSET